MRSDLRHPHTIAQLPAASVLASRDLSGMLCAYNIMLPAAKRKKPRPDDRAEAAQSAGPQLSGTNLERAGDHNQRVTLHAVRVNGPVTRTELALKTGLTPAAIANITNRLLNDRLILRAGRLRGARGQPATKLIINPDS